MERQDRNNDALCVCVFCQPSVYGEVREASNHCSSSTSKTQQAAVAYDDITFFLIVSSPQHGWRGCCLSITHRCYLFCAFAIRVVQAGPRIGDNGLAGCCATASFFSSADLEELEALTLGTIAYFATVHSPCKQNETIRIRITTQFVTQSKIYDQKTIPLHWTSSIEK